MKTFILLALVMGCGGAGNKIISGDADEGQGDLIEDEIGPEIDHDPISESQPGGVDVQITAFVDDEEGDVLTVELYYSQSTSTDWQTVTMSLVDPASGEFRGTIPGTQVGSAEMRYYIWAMDDAANESIDPLEADIDRLEAYTFGVSTL
jgi:hypothetical protein